MGDLKKEKDDQMKKLMARWKVLKKQDPAASLAAISKSLKETATLSKELKPEKD